MSRTASFCAFLLLGALFCSGCGNEPKAEPLRRAATSALASATADEVADEDHARPAKRAERRKIKRYGQPVHVYVDGVFTTVIKYWELPPQLPEIIETMTTDSGESWQHRYFAWQDFLAAIGIDASAQGRLRQAHFHGGRGLVCIVEGAEMKRVGRKFGFSFTRGTAGKARMDYPADGIAKNTWVDKLRAVAFYFDKAPPVLEKGVLRMPNGQPLEGKAMAYGDGERHGGTRVYLDGVFKGSFRRRGLPTDALLDPADPKSPYNLRAALAGFGVDLTTVKRAHFISPHDRIMAELPGVELQPDALPKPFVLARHSRGRIRVDGVGDDKTESILLFAARQPAERQPAVPQPSARQPADHRGPSHPPAAPGGSSTAQAERKKTQ